MLTSIFSTLEIKPLDKIHFHELDITISLLQRRDLKKFLLDMFKKEKKEVERIDIIFCSDIYLLHLNKKYLNHNYYTDTITFDLSEQANLICGEIYISIDTVRANAKSLKILPRLELIRVIIHSCLHLCGYLDKPQHEFLKMEKKQEAYLQQWGVSRETQIGG